MSNGILVTADWHIKRNYTKYNHNNNRQKQLEKNVNYMISYAVKHGVKTFCILGDIFDNENPTNNEITFFVKNIEKLVKNNIHVIMLLGNHEFKMVSDISVNSLTAIKSIINIFNPELVTIVTNGHYVKKIGGVNYVFISWHDDLYETVKKLGIKYKDSICMTHGSLYGALSEDGYELKGGKYDFQNMMCFKNFKSVYLGDFHRFQRIIFGDVIITYVGSIIKMRWSDKTHRRFVIIDSESTKSKSIKLNDIAMIEYIVEKNIIPSDVVEYLKYNYELDNSYIAIKNMYGISANKLLEIKQELLELKDVNIYDVILYGYSISGNIAKNVDKKSISIIDIHDYIDAFCDNNKLDNEYREYILDKVKENEIIEN